MVEPTAIQMSQAAQIEQARRAVAQLRGEKEMFVRLVICLRNAMVEGREVPTVGEHLCIRREEYEQVPNLYSLQVSPVDVKEDRELEEGEDEVPSEQMLVVVVEKKTGTNGDVAVPEGPRLIVP